MRNSFLLLFVTIVLFLTAPFAGLTVRTSGPPGEASFTPSADEGGLPRGDLRVGQAGTGSDLEVGNRRALLPLQAILQNLGLEVPARTGFVATPATGDGQAELPTVGSYENLVALLTQAATQGFRGGFVGPAVKAQEAAPKTASAPPGGVPALASAPNSAAPDARTAAPASFSRTNVQVEGVDEADVVKTDGHYLYQVNDQRVIIVQAYPPQEMKLVSVLGFGEENWQPRELYVDDRYLVIIGSGVAQVPSKPSSAAGEATTEKKAPVAAEKKAGSMIVWPKPAPVPFSRPTTRAVVFDITNKAEPLLVRQVEIEGQYVSSRKIGASVYLVANKYLDYYQIMKGKADDVAPVYRDSARANGDFMAIPFGEIHYFPGPLEPNYLLLAGFNLDRPQEPVKVSTYLGVGQNVYASLQNLYVAAPYFEEKSPENPLPVLPGRPGIRAPIFLRAPDTIIYKFNLNQGLLAYQGQGVVPGTLLNQFSMDEYNGYFRIATTRGNPWAQGEDTSKNNIYILDSKLKIKGKLEDIAPGEKIYSVRFLGNRGYLVTFKTVDPLFVVDLHDPAAPKILGALKIPGYSDYLHPYDENHLLGFGKETVELPRKDGQGNVVGTMAFYQGMKMALFDVTDVEHPIEKFKEIIGDRGTDSELLHNHKALLFDRENNLLAFPVQVMEVKEKPAAGSGVTSSGSVPVPPAYGQFVFQGAYVYNLDLEHGFTLKGRITHLTPEDYLKSGQYGQHPGKYVERILYINNTLYTLSKQMIKANALDTLQEENALAIPPSGASKQRLILPGG
ncbi:MAG: beta-propeller domain-containing protein [Firmicutes bacterium]|nr:beta-propeller domain-containing protein [Bacillota bacterium]